MFDDIIVNARIYTMENEGEFFSSMGIRQGIIEKLFESDPANPNSISKNVIDVEGKIILPGLNDCHAHFIGSAIGAWRTGLVISEMKDGKLYPDSMSGVCDKLRNYVEKSDLDESEIIICSNFIIGSFRENRLPYHNEINEWVPNRDVIFFSIDGHAGSCSTSILKKLDYNPDNHDGIFKGKELRIFTAKLGSLFGQKAEKSDILHRIENTINDAIKKGIVGVSCMEGLDEHTLWFFRNYAGKLPFHFRFYGQVRDVGLVENLSDILLSKRLGGCGGSMQDGAVGAKTAAFFEPYLGEPENYGRLYYPEAQLLNDLKEYYSKGFQFTSHAIGTAAIDRIVNAYDRVLTENDDFQNKLRNRVDHFEFPTEAQVQLAIEKLNLLVVPQPGFAWIDENYPGMGTYKKYLKPEIVDMQIPLKTIYEMGGIICGSSDAPVQSIDPFLQIHGMVNFPIVNERLSPYQAFRTYTFNAAYATFEENIRGTLSEGKLADFIVLKDNPFKIPKEKIIELKVEQTFIRGKRTNNLKISDYAEKTTRWKI